MKAGQESRPEANAARNPMAKENTVRQVSFGMKPLVKPLPKQSIHKSLPVQLPYRFPRGLVTESIVQKVVALLIDVLAKQNQPHHGISVVHVPTDFRTGGIEVLHPTLGSEDRATRAYMA